MKRAIRQFSAGANRPEAWCSFTALTLVAGPAALLLILMPASVFLPAGYALGVLCTMVASVFFGASRQKPESHRYPEPGVPDRAHGERVEGDPDSGYRNREQFLCDLARELNRQPSPTLLGVIRISNYDRMAALDVEVADRFLSVFHRRLQEALGKSRRLGRVESNCFAIWFADCEDVAAARTELQALSYALTQQVDADMFAIEPELETGAAVTVDQRETSGELIGRALASLDKADASAGQGAGSGKAMTDLRRTFMLEQGLRQAITRSELVLEYQPLIDTSAMRVSGAEALLRWNHPELGLVSPVEFIPLLEQSGLMNDVGIWVLNSACRQLRQWRASGQTDFRMAINLSARQLQNPDLTTIISRTVQNHGLPSSSIEFELTETAAMEDMALTLSLFRALRDAGFSLAIDDFGAGYSSLSYLKNLPFTKLKIDREFVSHIDESSASRAICKALLELASGLGISALAEGVERREEVDTLARLGCTSFQGFYFSRPLAAPEFTKLTTDPNWLASICSPVADMQAELERQYS